MFLVGCRRSAEGGLDVQLVWQSGRMAKVLFLYPYRPGQIPTGGAGIEIGRLRSNIRNAPSGQVLVECRRTAEHIAHVGDGFNTIRKKIHQFERSQFQEPKSAFVRA